MTNGIKTSLLKPIAVWVVICGLHVACTRGPWQAAGGFVSRGNHLFAQGRYQEAVIQYRKALQKDPQHGEAEYRLGLTYLKLSDRELAYASFERALELMPGHEDSMIQLANILLQVHLTDPEGTGFVRSRIENYIAQLLVKDPRSFAAHRIQAFVAGADGRPAEALRLFQIADGLRPGQCDINVGLTQNMIAAGQLEAAERPGRAFLGAHPECGPMYDFLYAQLLKSGRTKEAEALLESKIAANPSNAFYAAQLAEHFWRLNQRNEMEAVLRRLEQHASSIPRAHLEAGDFYARIKEWDKAIRAYQRGAAAEDKVKEAEYLKRITSCYLALGDVASAAQTLDTLLATFPTDADAVAGRAAIRLATGKADEAKRAIAELEQAVKRAPEDPRLRFELARSYLQTQRKAEAIPHLHEVQELSGNWLDTIFRTATLTRRVNSPLAFSNSTRLTRARVLFAPQH